MTELKRTFHKQRKWVCRKCGYVRFQQVKKVIPDDPEKP